MPSKLKQRLSVTFIVLTLATAGTSLQATAETTASVIAVPYASPGWSYKEVPHGEGQGFELPTFDAFSWSHGQGGFGTTDGVCPWNNPDQVHTAWTPDTDMLLRREFLLPGDISGLHIEGTIDNNAEIFINGKPIPRVESGFCEAGKISIDVPAADLRLHPPSVKDHNVLAIRATDLGQATFVDVQIGYLGVPTLPAMDGGTFVNIRSAQMDYGWGEQCTTAYSVSTPTRTMMLTARHCMDENTPEVPETTNANLYLSAPVVITTTDDKAYFSVSLFCYEGFTACIHPPDKLNPGDIGDMVAFAPDTAVPTNKVQTADGPPLPVLDERAWGDLGKQKICHWGQATLEQCGSILSGQSPDSAEVAFSAKGDHGDSGGPVYVKVYLKNGKYVYQKNGKPVGVHAIGMTIKAGSICYRLKGCVDTTVFIPMSRIEQTLGVKLLK